MPAVSLWLTAGIVRFGWCSKPMAELTIHGVLRTGLGVAAQFTELPWVREQFQRKLGLDVWPGTVNLQVQDPAGLAALARLRAGGGVPIDPPGAGDGPPLVPPNSGGEARPR